MPKPKWFRANTISCLTEAEVARLQDARAHGAISEEEESDATIPTRPTKFNETIAGWGRADQNVYLGSDTHFGRSDSIKDPIPLPKM